MLSRGKEETGLNFGKTPSSLKSPKHAELSGTQAKIKISVFPKITFGKVF